MGVGGSPFSGVLIQRRLVVSALSAKLPYGEDEAATQDAEEEYEALYDTFEARVLRETYMADLVQVVADIDGLCGHT